MIKSLKIILILFIICVGIVSGCKQQDKSIDFDNLYNEFKNAKTSRERTDIVLKFSSSREKSLDFLLKKLEIEQDDLIRVDILANILILADRDTAEKILPYMHDSNCHVRHFTLSALVALGYNKIDGLLKSAVMNDDCKLVRALAIRSFGYIGNKSAIPFLEDYRKKSTDEQINKAIDMALEKLNSQVKKKGKKGVTH